MLLALVLSYCRRLVQICFSRPPQFKIGRLPTSVQGRQINGRARPTSWFGVYSWCVVAMSTPWLAIALNKYFVPRGEVFASRGDCHAVMLIANQLEIDYPIATGKATGWQILLVAENSTWKQKLMQSAGLSVQMASFSGADLLCVTSKQGQSWLGVWSVELKVINYCLYWIWSRQHNKTGPGNLLDWRQPPHYMHVMSEIKCWLISEILNGHVHLARSLVRDVCLLRSDLLV
jgi:hypothetical protein